MKDEKHVRWLYNQLPFLISKKILTQAQAGGIKDYYGKIDANAKKKMTVMIFAVIGALLTGLGLILMIAYNWDRFPKVIKITIAFVPLIVSLLLAWFAANDKKASAARRESTAIFWFLSVGAVIAILSQVYHISGHADNFVLTWAILSVGIMYLLNSTSASILYLFLISTWSPFSQTGGGTGLLYWPLLGAFLPFFIAKFRENRYGVSQLWMAWLLAISVAVSTGVSLEKCVPGLWMVIYAALFTLMYVTGGKLYEEGANWAQKPFLTFGVCGIAILMLMYTYNWPWRHIGWVYYRHGGNFHEWAAIQDYLLAAGLPIASLVMLYTESKKKRELYLDFGLAFVLVLAAYAAVAWFDAFKPVVLVVFNLYTLYMAVRAIYGGIQRSKLDVLNAGMVLFCALVISRFYDSDMSLLIRGLIFVILGAGFLGVNLFVAGKKEAEK